MSGKTIFDKLLDQNENAGNEGEERLLQNYFHVIHEVRITLVFHSLGEVGSRVWRKNL